MRIAISSTNPCHLYDLARELHGMGRLARYYSGYPGWRLDRSEGIPLTARSWRTVLTYGLLRLPAGLRPASRDLFRWQDAGFDRAVAGVLDGGADILHAMPGQCLETFRVARRLGVATVLNHATAPVRQWLAVMEPEYRRRGLEVADVTPYDSAWIERVEAESALADAHCVASEVVRRQLLAEGVPGERILVVPYGADPRVFHPRGARRPDGFRMVFAGQFGIRKGIETLLDALSAANRADWSLDVFGPRLPEAGADLRDYHGRTPVRFHGPVSQSRLAAAFRAASVLVLPSIEEAFGLVVPQALACGLPCVVSDAVGAGDLITHRHNGSVFPSRNAAALADELHWWEKHGQIVDFEAGWAEPAARFVAGNQRILAAHQPRSD